MKSRSIAALGAIAVLGCGGAIQKSAGPVAVKADTARFAASVHSLVGTQGRLLVDGVDCGTSCSGSRALGTSVALMAQGDGFDRFAVDCPGAACFQSDVPSFNLDMTADHTVQAIFRPRINFVFVTSTTHTADMGGLSGADAICNGRAQAAGLGGSKYLAWLSTTAVAASDRLRPARGWIRTDGLSVIDSVSDLEGNEFFYPIRLDESGHDVADGARFGFQPVWTGTLPNFTSAIGNTCSDWTGTDSTNGAMVGSAAGGAVLWNWGALYACQGWSLPIYCFEADFTVPVEPPPPPAGSRVAFVSSYFTPVEGGSIADADAQCAADAAKARLPGSFKALLADVGKSAASRFDASKGAWHRLDGTAVVPHAADLFKSGGPVLLAPIDLKADGITRAFGMSSAWTGFESEFDDYSATGTAATTCNGWSTNSVAARGTTSLVNFTFQSFRDMPNWPIPACNEPQQLYCLQE